MVAFKLFHWYHELTDNSGSNLIGFTWGHNGCKRLFNYLGWEDKEESEWFCFDIKGKDQSSQVAELEMYCADCKLLIDFVSMDPKWKRINEALLLYITMNTSSHYVRWYGNAFRIVIGTLFSGDYSTSDYNTKHVGIMFISYILHTVPRSDWKFVFLDKLLRLVVQGDDIFGRIPLRLAHWLSGKGFAEYITTRHSHYIKEGTFISGASPLTEFDVNTGQIVGKPGIKLLQRYFMLNPFTGYPEPFRPTFVIISKLFGATKAVTPGLFLSKCIGLAYDTMGTNPHCYYLIEKAFLEVVKFHGITTDEIRQNLINSKDSMFRSSSYKWGLWIDAESWYSFPTLDKIRTLFLKDPSDEETLKRVTRGPKTLFMCF